MKRKHLFIKSIILAAICALTLCVPAFAKTYSEEDTVPGLSGIQPGDILTLPENTSWASLTAEWGSQIVFKDADGNLLTNDVISEGESGLAPQAPKRSGMNFASWKRLDSNGAEIQIDGNSITYLGGAGPVLLQAEYEPKGLPDDVDDGTITIINASHEHTYEGYKILDAEISKDNINSVIYTIREDSIWRDLVEEYFNLTEYRLDEGVQVYQATLKDGVDIKEAFENVLETGRTPDLEAIQPDRDGIVSWGDVPFGYYAITSSMGSWVTVNTNKPDVSVIDKNQTSTLDKNIVTGTEKSKVSNAAFGQSVPFEIDVYASNYYLNEMVTYYRIHDEIDTGFDYNFTDESNIVVQVIGTQGTPTPMSVPKVDDLADLEEAEKGYFFDYTEEAREFDVIIKWGDIAPVYTDEFNHIIIKYQATVNNDANVGAEGNTNTASYVYEITEDYDADNPPEESQIFKGREYDPEVSVETTTYVQALSIEKVDADDNTKHLAGVRFACDSINAVQLADGLYAIATEEDDVGDYVSYFEVPDDGYIVIEGLQPGTYVFRETKALPGYGKLPSAGTTIVIPAVTEDDPYQTAGTVYGIDCAECLLVENKAGFVLPETGGTGTTVIYIVGGLLIIGACVFLILKKKKSGKEESKEEAKADNE